MTASEVSDTALYTVWGFSLVLGLVVILVVGGLLAMIVRTAREIEDTASEIWTVGQRIANNTVHIPLLSHTNRTLTGVLVRASGIHEATGAIRDHARECPGCPHCVLGSKGSGD